MTFENKSLRLKNYNYSNTGYYFITISIRGKNCSFGYIEAEKLILNGYGLLVEKYWKEIPLHFSNITLDEFIIMPDHIHGILIVQDTSAYTPVPDRHDASVSTPVCDKHDTSASVPDRHACQVLKPHACQVLKADACQVQGQGNETQTQQRRQNELLPVAIGAFKSKVTREINIINKSLNFRWKKSYYDHIIRNYKSLDRIRNYIKYNYLKENRKDNFFK